MTEVIKTFIPYKVPFHLCPICGLPSGNSSRICGRHISWSFDVNGNLIDVYDTPIIPTGCYQNPNPSL